MGVLQEQWIILTIIVAVCFHGTHVQAIGQRPDSDVRSDHINASVLKTLIGEQQESFESDIGEPLMMVSREAKSIEPKTEEEILMLKEKTFKEALALMGKRNVPLGPGEYCDEFITGEDFYIHSPSYPNNYPANTTCKYQIYRRHPDFCGVLITVLRLDLAVWPRIPDQDFNDITLLSAEKEDGTCEGDSLIINGVHHCGRYQRGQTALFTFPSSFLSVEFQSGDTYGASGFLLLGRQVKTCRQPKSLGKALVSMVPCNSRIDRDTFALTSPGYPSDYEHNIECHFFVSRGEGVCALKLQVNDFHLEDGSCMFDYLEVQGTRLCGKLPPGFTRYYEFEGPQIDIRFRSDESTKRGGFRIFGERVGCDEASLIKPSIQSRPARDGDDTFTRNVTSVPPPLSLGSFPTAFLAGTVSPNPREAGPLPSNNQSEIDISYILSVIGRRPITGLGEIDEEFVERNESTEAENEEDFTELDPGLIITEETTTNADQNLVGDPDFNPFTSTGLPPTFPTIPGRIPTTFPTTVDFPSTSSFPTFPTTTLAGESCDEVYADETFTASSPGYPTAYSANLNCIYYVARFSVDVCGLQVNLIDVDLPTLDPQTGQCTGDYLNIGGTKLCGTFQGRVLTFDFKEQTLEMTFHSDETTAGKGFRLEAKQLTDCGPVPPDPGQCDTITQQSSFMLLSPGYPSAYPPNTDCTTTVIKSSPSVVNLLLELVDFELGSSFGCTGDYLEIVGTGQRLCGRLSGQTRTYPFLGNSISIKFHSGVQGTGAQRFRIRVTQATSGGPGGCGGVVTSASAYIRSPNYPLPYPSNSYCTFAVFKTSSDVCQLQLRLLDFDIEDSSGCAKDFLQIGHQERLCGRRYSGEVRKYHFSSNRLDLYFRSDVYGSGRGFRAEVSQLTCGHFHPMYPSYPSYPSRPSYQSYWPSYRPYRPSKPWHKFSYWWKKNPFLRPYQISQSYSADYITSGGNSHESSFPNTGYLTLDSHYETTSAPPLTPLTPLPTTPSPFHPTTVTPTPLPTPFPTPPPQLSIAPLNSSKLTFRPIAKPQISGEFGKLALANQRQPKTEPSTVVDDVTGMCNKITNQRTFQVQSPGYPGPYYTDMRCLFRVRRSDASRCGIELLMDEFDVEETERCSAARLVIQDRSYCGVIPSGSHSVVPFSESGEILMEFVAGKYHSAAGFTMRGRQIGCTANSTSSLPSASVKLPTRPVKKISGHLTTAEDQFSSIFAKKRELIFPSDGIRKPKRSSADYEGWTPIY